MVGTGLLIWSTESLSCSILLIKAMAVLVVCPIASIVPWTTNTCSAPTARVKGAEVSSRLDLVHATPFPTQDVKVNQTGKVSFIVTLVAGAVPVFFTLIVKVNGVAPL